MIKHKSVDAMSQITRAQKKPAAKMLRGQDTAVVKGLL